MNTIETNARDFLSNPLHTYRRLAEHLNTTAPRRDGVRWTTDSAYHFCRTHGITSRRRCRSQPAASVTQRSHSRAAILDAITSAITATGTPLASLAPFSVSDITRLSGFPRATVVNNWDRLESELLTLAKLPPKPTVLLIAEDEV
jgi:hypothetical protein